MSKKLVMAIVLMAMVAGCARISESRLNPFNWFGRDKETTTTVPTIVVQEDTRPLVEQVVSVQADRTAGGAILRATGLPPTQGFWGAELVKDEARSTPSSLVYQFRLQPPPGPEPVSTPWSREVVAAKFLTEQDLDGVRSIQVIGARNARAVGR